MRYLSATTISARIIRSYSMVWFCSNYCGHHLGVVWMSFIAIIIAIVVARVVAVVAPNMGSAAARNSCCFMWIASQVDSLTASSDRVNAIFRLARFTYSLRCSSRESPWLHLWDCSSSRTTPPQRAGHPLRKYAIRRNVLRLSRSSSRADAPSNSQLSIMALMANYWADVHCSWLQESFNCWHCYA